MNLSSTSSTKKIVRCLALLLVFLLSSQKESLASGLDYIQEQADLITVTGTVTDQDGEPLPGVTVAIKGTLDGTITDINGTYAISAPSDAILEFRYLGFTTREMPIGGQQSIDITMELDVASLEEVVVVGYGTQRKGNVTGSVTSLDNNQLTMVPVANTQNLLAGRTPGVITKAGSGLPGGDGSDVHIRGFGNALVLVDGVQVLNGMQRTDPNDIESISVLKDAAAAVYGARAGNGVILITTKRGSVGKPKVQYNGSMTFQEATAFQDQVDAGQFVQLWREADLLDNGNIDATFTEQDLLNYQTRAPGYEGGDWVDALIKNGAPMYQHSLQVSGGTNNVKYFVSFGITDQESYFRSRDFDYDRYNTRVNVDVNASENLSFNVDLSLRRGTISRARESLGALWNDLSTAQPIYPTELPDPSATPTPSSAVPYTGFTERNPVAKSQKQYEGFWDRTDEMMRGRIGVEYRIPEVEGLKVNGQFNFVNDRRFEKELIKPFNVYQYVPATDEYIWQATSAAQSSLDEWYRTRDQIYPLVSLSYDQEFGNHTIGFLALYETITREIKTTGATSYDLLSTDVPELFVGDVSLEENRGGSSADIGRKSAVGRLNYRYKGRYLFEATFRADGNVLFAPDNRWGYFPSFSAGWVISEESFWGGLSNVADFAKLRVSYSQTGNDREDDLSNFDYLTGYGIQGNYMFGESIYTTLRTLGYANEDLTWETMTQYNVGLEATFLKGKLDLEADVFYRKREGMLATRVSSVPTTVGANLPLENINSQDQRGFEVALSYRDNVGPVKLTVAPNATFTRRKWIHYEEDINFDDPDEVRINQRSGQWVNRNFGYVSNGIFMTQEEINSYVPYEGVTTLRPGDVRFVDVNDDGIINWRDQQEIAYNNNLPEFTYGLNIAAEWKNFDLNVLIQGASRYSVRFAGAPANMFSNFSIPYDYQYNLRWQPDPLFPDVNVNPNAQLPSASFGSSASNTWNSDFFRKDVRYMRIKNVNLSYSIPSDIVSKAGFERFQIYVAAENLATFTNLGLYEDSFDPESTESSNSDRIYPLNRNYTVGVRLGF